MVFVELTAFTRRLPDLLDEAEYVALQFHLLARPDAGAVIPKGKGLRKVRWAAKGHGKRGGARVIYFWQTADGRIYLARIYAKNEREDIAADELKTIVKELGL